MIIAEARLWLGLSSSCRLRNVPDEVFEIGADAFFMRLAPRTRLSVSDGGFPTTNWYLGAWVRARTVARAQAPHLILENVEKP